MIHLVSNLQLDFSHLREHKFRHNFVVTMNPLFSCFLETESTEHYFLRCHNYVTFHTTLVNEFNSRNSKFSKLELDVFIRNIPYGDKKLMGKDNGSNFKLLTAASNFIKQAQRFEQALSLANEACIWHILILVYFTFSLVIYYEQ